LSKKVLHIDENHPILHEDLAAQGFENHFDFYCTKQELIDKISSYQGLIIRSRIPIDQSVLTAATNLEFIGRVGAGLENIDLNFAEKQGIHCIAAPEGNRNAVGEHALGLLLNLLNKLNKADKEIRSGLWDREANRGVELDGKTVGIIGYGHMGKQFARKLQGFDVEVLCYDIKTGIGDAHARQVAMAEFFEKVEIVSLHLPHTALTQGLCNLSFIEQFKHPIWLINTGRGSAVVTADLVSALHSNKVLGAGLDVLEFEKKSFENFFEQENLPEAFSALLQSDRVILSPHVAGWTLESHKKLAQTITEKVRAMYAS